MNPVEKLPQVNPADLVGVDSFFPRGPLCSDAPLLLAGAG